MALLCPMVVGPLSVFSSSARLQLLVPGAEVVLFNGTQQVSAGVAGAGDQRFVLTVPLTSPPAGSARLRSSAVR